MTRVDLAAELRARADTGTGGEPMTDNWLRRHYEDEAINLTTYFGGRIQIVRGRYASTINGHLGPFGFGFGAAEPVHAGHCDVLDDPMARGRFFNLPRDLALSVAWGGREGIEPAKEEETTDDDAGPARVDWYGWVPISSLYEAMDQTKGMDDPHRFHMLRAKLLSRISAATATDATAEDGTIDYGSTGEDADA